MPFLGDIKAGWEASKSIFITVAVVIALSVIGWQRHTIGSLRNQINDDNKVIGALQRDQASYQGTVEGLKQQFEKQAKEIDELKRQSDEQQDRIRKANKKVLQLEKEKKDRLLDISREQVGETCEAAMDYLKKKSQEMGQWSENHF